MGKACSRESQRLAGREMLLDRHQLSPRATPLAAALAHASSPPPSALTVARLSGQEVGRGRERDAWALLEVEATVREVTKDKARV